MIIGVIFKDGKEIDRGICTGSTKWHKEHPEQDICIVDNTNSYESERCYSHKDKISFQELQDNGNGWEIVYDSNERIDRTVEYPLPGWFMNGGPIPKHEHKMNDKGTIDTEFKGYYS